MAELLAAGVSKSEVGILFRKNRSSEAVERVLKARKIPIATSTPAVENPYVREAVAPLLRLLLDNDDSSAFIDVALLSRSIDCTKLEELQRRMEAEKRRSLYNAARSTPPFERPKGVGEFLNRLNELKPPPLPEDMDQLMDWAEGWLVKVEAPWPRECAPSRCRAGVTPSVGSRRIPATLVSGVSVAAAAQGAAAARSEEAAGG